MKKNIANKWVKALRSGKYKQGREGLCQINEGGKKFKYNHCCLGVLCELYNEEHTGKDKLKVSFSSSNNEDYRVLFDRNPSYLPRKVKKWAGMKSTYGRIYEPLPEKRYNDYDGVDRGLSAMNDDGISFKTISDIIKKHYKVL